MYIVKRNKIYHLFYKDKVGKLHSVSTKCSMKKDANKFASKYLQGLKEGRENESLFTYSEFQEYYKKYASSRFTQSYQEFIGYAFQQFRRIAGEKTLIKDLTELHIEEFIHLKLTEAGPRIVNGYLRTLQAAFQRAVELGFLSKNIFIKVKKLKPEQNPPVFLSKTEFEKIIEAEKNPELKFLYRFAVLTGMRMSEIRYLRWDAVNLNKQVIQVRNHNEFTTKSKKARVIPIHRDLLTELKNMQMENKDKYIFQVNGEVYDRKKLSTYFKKAIKKAKLSDEYHFHTLRHTFASWLVQSGVSLYVVSKLLGHSDIKTTQIYSHLASDNFKHAVDVLNLN